MKPQAVFLGAIAAYLLYRSTRNEPAAIGGVFQEFEMKLPGMKKAQEFTIYPYDGGDFVVLQSATRITKVNLRTGEAILSKAHSNGSYFHDLLSIRGATAVTVPSETLVELQKYLWENSGRQSNGVIMIDNQELFSK